MEDKNIPLGISQQYNPETKSTELTWSYRESADIQYFEIEYWDEDERKWKPFDGRSGVVKKNSNVTLSRSSSSGSGSGGSNSGGAVDPDWGSF